MIESYDFGRIVIDGRKFGSDVIIFPDRIDGNWWRKEGHTLSVDDVKEIVEAKPEVLVVATGYSGLMKVHPETEQYLRSSGIELIAALKIAAFSEVCLAPNDPAVTEPQPL